MIQAVGTPGRAGVDGDDMRVALQPRSQGGKRIAVSQHPQGGENAPRTHEAIPPLDW